MLKLIIIQITNIDFYHYCIKFDNNLLNNLKIKYPSITYEEIEEVLKTNNIPQRIYNIMKAKNYNKRKLDKKKYKYRKQIKQITLNQLEINYKKKWMKIPLIIQIKDIIREAPNGIEGIHLGYHRTQETIESNGKVIVENLLIIAMFAISKAL